MIWTYKRGDEVLRLETRFDNDSSEYLLVIHRHDGSIEIQRFGNTVAFQRRLDAVAEQLGLEQWEADGVPVFLRDGWKI